MVHVPAQLFRAKKPGHNTCILKKARQDRIIERSVEKSHRTNSGNPDGNDDKFNLNMVDSNVKKRLFEDIGDGFSKLGGIMFMILQLGYRVYANVNSLMFTWANLPKTRIPFLYIGHVISLGLKTIIVMMNIALFSKMLKSVGLWQPFLGLIRITVAPLLKMLIDFIVRPLLEMLIVPILKFTIVGILDLFSNLIWFISLCYNYVPTPE